MINYMKCNCGSKVYLTSVIPMNGQVNFICADEECEAVGFINKGKIYFQYDEDE